MYITPISSPRPRPSCNFPTEGAAPVGMALDINSSLRYISQTNSVTLSLLALGLSSSMALPENGGGASPMDSSSRSNEGA